MNAPPPRPPTRALAVACNVMMALLLASSFGACTQYGCSSNHLDSGVTTIVAIGTGTFCAAASAVAIVILALNLRAKTSAGTVTGLVLTIVLGFVSTILTPFFWFIAGSSGVGFALGGWGRPLRVRRRAVTPGVRASSEWASGPRPRVDALDREARELLRDLWLHDARKEHASVPAFGQVAWQLVALGAPADLVRRAHVSCLQEIDHAERCFALASAYAGEDLGVQDMPALLRGASDLPRDRTRALVKVATEALVDGALLEDFNAELAATALADVKDPAAREALEHIVEDERDHAALAWDIVAFCIDRGGEPVARAVRAAFERLPDAPASLYAEELSARVAALADKEALYAHGRVRLERAPDVFRARKAACAERIAALVRRDRAALAAA
jgi:hypothetical protein